MQTFRTVLAVMAFTIIAFLLCAVSDQPATASKAQQQQSPASTGLTAPAPTATVPAATTRKVTEYRLPPGVYKKAHDASRIFFRLVGIGFVYGLIVLWLILHWKLGPKYRDWAERSSAMRFLQTLVFWPPLLLTIAVLRLPLDIYSQMVEKKLGISVQRWSSWSCTG
jgi:hypothetical protein